MIGKGNPKRALWWLAALAIGCTPAPPCPDASVCAPGLRRWTSDGACLPSDPCATNTTCAAQSRVCRVVAGQAQCGRCLDDLADDGTHCTPVAQHFVGPYRVSRDHFGVWDGSHYRRTFLRGVNVGGARPGNTVDEDTITVDDWMRWMGIWADAGMNVVRVYRVHPAPLYQALIQWNTANTDRPIYLVQGVYYREIAPGATSDLLAYGDALDADVTSAIDCVHGQCAGYPDASPWVIAWLVGREIGFDEVQATNAAHPGMASHAGMALSIANASASEAWAVTRMDHAVMHERTTYSVERPIAFSNWLQLDPLTHPTEPATSGQDVAQIDLSHVDASLAPAGHFVSYHAYPYFPNFVNEDPTYQTYVGATGPDPYRGVLADLRAYHDGQALLIAEVGVPTSLVPATRPSLSGMTQGGITEEQQGRFATQLLTDVEDMGAAGGIWFQWEDGWWKRTWTSDLRAFPQSDYPLWHNLLCAEQGYGLMAFAPTPTDPTMVASSPSGRVRGVSVTSDAEGLRFHITLDRPLDAAETVEIGIDVLDRHRGEPHLPSGTALVTSAAEFAIVLDGGATHATMTSTPCLDLTELPRELLAHASPATQAGGCGGWSPMRWLLSGNFHYQASGCYISDDFYPLGVLPIRRATDPASSRDVVVVDASTTQPSVSLAIPWNLIVVADPSTGAVFDDHANMYGVVQSTTTDGVVLAVVVGGELVETTPYVWPTWRTAPPTTERLKDSAGILFAHTRALPRWID
jgi:hypothetical protein